MTRDRADLGRFLRSRRDRLTPAQAGMLAFPGPRRVPGLRKEELALLAAVSPDYYSKLEQGRQATVSREVLDALARALRLDEVEHAHLLDLAAPHRLRDAPAGGGGRQRPDPGLLRLMSALDHLPVLLLGRGSQVLARNALFTAVVGEIPVAAAFVRFLFLDPAARERILNWEHFAAAAIGALRREVARHPHDRPLTALVAALRAGDDDAARWWDDQGVRDYTSVAKRIRHPVAGDLSFDIEIVSPPHDPDQRLVVYTAQPDSTTRETLKLLASWQVAEATGPTADARSRSVR